MKKILKFIFCLIICLQSQFIFPGTQKLAVINSLIIIGDHHNSYYTEEKEEIESDYKDFMKLKTWLEEISKNEIRTKYIYEIREDQRIFKIPKIADANLLINYQKCIDEYIKTQIKLDQTFHEFTTELLMTEFFAFINLYKLNNINFFPGDIRIFKDFQKCYDFIILERQTSPKKIFTLLDLEITKDYLDSIKRNLNNVANRIEQLKNKETKELVYSLMDNLLIKIANWDNEFYNISKSPSHFQTEDLIEEGLIIGFVDFADLGFILSIFESIDEGYEQIIIHLGETHALNLINFFGKHSKLLKENVTVANNYEKILSEIKKSWKDPFKISVPKSESLTDSNSNQQTNTGSKEIVLETITKKNIIEHSLKQLTEIL